MLKRANSESVAADCHGKGNSRLLGTNRPPNIDIQSLSCTGTCLVERIVSDIKQYGFELLRSSQFPLAMPWWLYPWPPRRHELPELA